MAPTLIVPLHPQLHISTRMILPLTPLPPDRTESQQERVAKVGQRRGLDGRWRGRILSACVATGPVARSGRSRSGGRPTLGDAWESQRTPPSRGGASRG